MIYYHLSYQNPLTHFVDIKITIKDNQQQELYLQLPAWRPGRYELQHFAQKLRTVSATANGENIPIEKVSKDRWKVQTGGAGEVEISYSFFARQMDAGGSWLDEQQLYLNPINCLMAVEGREQEPCKLQLQLPEEWQIACALQELERHVLEAKDFDELADSPFIASDSLKRESFEMGGYTFHIWLQGDCKLDWEKMKQDFIGFTKEQL
ncbi:MAG: M61 family peptidase, partial [Pontibacter sp.]|nr:M61 family peptidase [Pontibacter sp.]